MLGRSGLPAAPRAALVEMLSEAAAEGRDVRALESALDRLAAWLRTGDAARRPPAGGQADDGRRSPLPHLVPDVTGRRSGREILGRLRRKWELGHSLHDVLDASATGPRAGRAARPGSRGARSPRARSQARARFRGRDSGLVADARARGRRSRSCGTRSRLRSRHRVLLADDLRAGRAERRGPVEVCGGGRYDGLARVLGQRSRRSRSRLRLRPGTAAEVLAARGSEPAPEEVHPEGAVVVVTAPGLTSSAIALVQSRRENGWRTLLLLETSLARAKAYAREMRLAKVLMVNHELEHPESFEEHRVDESL